MSMPESAEVLAERIRSAPAPVLFLDTCTILDVVRAAHPDYSVREEEVSSALELVKMVGASRPEVWLITSETIVDEWDANILTVKSTLESPIRKADVMRSKLIAIADVIHGGNYDVGQKIEPLNLPDHLENLSRQLLASCQKVKVEDGCSVRAGLRINKCLAPASKGKQEFKDCQIFEVFLDAGRHLRGKGVTEALCFVTANKNDYGEPKKPNDPIAQDLESIQANYLNSLNWALAVAQGRASV
jgi:hypothetical protein